MGISARGAAYGRVLSTEQISQGASTASGLTVPAAARSAFVTMGANPVRFRSDGTDPTTSVGHYVAANGNLELFGDELNTIKFISTTSTSNIFVTYYKE